jgi:type IV pilus assembly protein PilB
VSISTLKPRLGQLLIDQGLLTQQQLDEALAAQRTSGRMLGEVLIEKNFITPAILASTLAASAGIKVCQLRHGLIDPALLKLVGDEEADRLLAIPLFKVRDTLTVAMAEPQSLPAIDRLRQLTNCRIRPVFAHAANIKEYINKYKGGNVNVDEFLTSLVDADVSVVDKEAVDEGPVSDLDKMVSGSPIVNLVNLMLLSAVRDKASDIHIEPDKKGTRIRYRIDGVLRDLMKPPTGMHSAIVSRVKVIGKMDIAEKRLPQEGRVRIVAEGRDIDLRVSSMPTLLGEKLVLRILDKANLRMNLSELGFRPEMLEAFKRMLIKPNGLVLVTGPTGSGKTTTLYSALDLLRDPELNLVTVEDPVEYQLDLVNQIQVNQQIGMTFAKALRSILRQDPDVIMVGEIRDEETARVSIQAAQTGHLVLATLHTNDAPAAVARLTDMGIEPYLLSGALNGVVAQRLVRTVCPACANKYYPSEAELRDAGLLAMAGRAFRKGAGCLQCHDTGFRGRAAIYEVMEITSDMRRAVHHGSSTQDLRDRMAKLNMKSLREEGVALAIDGRTTLDEVLLATQRDEEGDVPAPSISPPPPATPAASLPEEALA